MASKHAMNMILCNEGTKNINKIFVMYAAMCSLCDCCSNSMINNEYGVVIVLSFSLCFLHSKYIKSTFTIQYSFTNIYMHFVKLSNVIACIK